MVNLNPLMLYLKYYYLRIFIINLHESLILLSRLEIPAASTQGSCCQSVIRKKFEY